MIKRLFKYFVYWSKYYVPKKVLVFTYPFVKFDKYRRIKKYHKKVFESRNAMFIHIPKNAGTSILKAFIEGSICDGMDDPFKGYTVSAEYYRHFFGNQVFNGLYKFCFVRNPWDRLLSAYSYLDRMNWLQYLGNFESFEYFVKKWLNKRRLFSDVHFIPQQYFICDDNGNMLMDYVGRFESLQDDVSFVSNKIRFNIDVKHLNRSFHNSYRDVYDDEMIDIVSVLYKNDIQLFNYEF